MRLIDGIVAGSMLCIVGMNAYMLGFKSTPEPKELNVHLESMDQLALNYLIKEAEEQSMEFQALTKEIQEIKTELVKLRKDLKK